MYLFFSDKGKSGVQPDIAFGKWWFVPNLIHTVLVACSGEILEVGWEGEEADEHLISMQEIADRCSGNVFISLETQWSLPERDNLYFLL